MRFEWRPQLLSVLHFAKNAKDAAPHRVGDASEIKSLDRPPVNPVWAWI
jgi:hypothetical protein